MRRPAAGEGWGGVGGFLVVGHMAAPPLVSSPVEFLLRRPVPRRRRLPLIGAFFAPMGLAGAPLLRALSSLAAPLLGALRSPWQQRNLAALMRRLALLPLLLPVDGDGAAFSAAANICRRELYVVLFRAELLVSYVASVGRAGALLRAPHLASSFRDLDAELVVVLDVLPATLLLSWDAAEQLDLLRALCRRRAGLVPRHRQGRQHGVEQWGPMCGVGMLGWILSDAVVGSHVEVEEGERRTEVEDKGEG
ncbi:hypothetical protein ACP4OV_003039 [Aristida adscensionis]